MPPKSKRVKSLQEAAMKAREAKRSRLEPAIATDEVTGAAFEETSTI